jgi:hypothetical protein
MICFCILCACESQLQFGIGRGPPSDPKIVVAPFHLSPSVCSVLCGCRA